MVIKRTYLLSTLFVLFLWMPSGRAQTTTAQTYIETHQDWAIEAMHQFGIPASVMLAIAMHESANGTSKVATYLNNHFGIKGTNHNKQIRSSYKGYDAVKDSYDDFIHYLKAHKSFASLFTRYTSYDYRNWVLGIQRGGYASSKVWARHILALIEKHQLFTLDNRPTDYVEPKSSTIDHTTSVASVSYTVKKGDTLSTIAKRYKTSIKKIKDMNGLRNDRLKIGQRLKI